MTKVLQNKDKGLGFLRHWKVMTMTLLLLTFSISQMWGQDLNVEFTSNKSSDWLKTFNDVITLSASGTSFNQGGTGYYNASASSSSGAVDASYFGIAATSAIEKVQLLIAPNSTTALNAILIGWDATPTLTTCDTSKLISGTSKVNTYAGAEWIEWDLSNSTMEVTYIRLYKALGSNKFYYKGGTKVPGPSSTQTCRVYGVKVWLKKKVTINPDGGSTETSGWTLSEGKYIKSGIVSGTSVTLPTMTKEGNTFAGWKNKDNEDITSPITITKDTVLTAQWISSGAATHAISYTNTKGASTSGLPTEYYEGTGIASFAALADVEGFHFTGWSPSSIAADATNDPFEVEAQWTPTYSVTYNLGGATGDAPTETAKYAGQSFDLAAAPSWAGHAFDGWLCNIDSDVKDAESNYTMTAAPTTFTAQWTTLYTVTKGTHANGDFTISPASQVAGGTVTLDPTPADGFMFSAWEIVKTSDASATGITVTNKQFEMPAYGVTVNATFVTDTRKKVLILVDKLSGGNWTGTGTDKLYAALKDAYNVTVAVPDGQTLTDYDLIVLHESIGGSNTNAAVTGCKTTSVPVLNTKTYFYGGTNDASSRWQWGAPNGGQSIKGCTLNSGYCNAASHPIFADVTINEGFVEIINTAEDKCMQPVVPISGKEGYLLATSPNAATPGGNGYAIQEIPAGGFRGATSGKYLLISASNGALSKLNANGQKLFQNAAAYLIGSTAWSPATAPTSPAIEATGGAIHAVGDAVTMTASASNVSATTLYAWYKGETLEAAEEAGAIQTAKTAAADGTTYSIASCELESAGTYWCVIVNAEGCEASASLELSVSSTPITTYDITYVSAKGTAPDAENAASVTLAEITGVSGWEHQGWKANVDVVVDDATVTANTLIANGKTAVLSADVTFTAVWRQVLTVTYNANGGTCGTASATWGEGDAALVLPDATVANLVFDGWYTEATGGTLIGRAGSTYTPTADIEIFAHFGAKLYQAVYANGFDAFINQSTKTVTVYYLDGTPAPALTSVKAMKADGSEVAAGTFVDNGSTIDVTIDEKTATYTVNKTAVTPYTYVSDDAVVFGGTETYVKTGNSFSTDASKLGWKFSKNDNDWSRELPGNNRIYFFIGAAESVTFTTGCTSDRSAKFYRNGELIKTETIAKNTGAVTVAGSNAPAMYAVVSNQTSGDGSIKSMTLAPWVPVTAVALKEGEDPISSKEIYATASFTLTAEVTPDNASNKTITWTSSNDAIATVADGVVTGVAANASPVTITASTVDGVTATCAVTVTAAPEPSADPVITAQPASANYYEGATIAALEVVATGESLSYQWYLGSDAISGAESATYTPTVSAIGSYVYHCVVTNTEAGKLPTSLASSNATITIAEDPSAIKLINKSTGAINTTNFITGVTANNNVHGENGAIFGSSSSNASVKGLSGLNKVVVYNATTTQTKIKLVLYNTNSAAQEVVLSTMAEGDVDPVGQAISVPSKELYSTGYITYNSTKNRTFYLHTKSTNVQISQIQVIESGDELAVAGKKDYSLNLNKGRVYAYASTAQTWEGLSMNLGSNYSPATTEYITFKDNALSFSVPNDVCLTITPARAGDKYYVTDVADGTDNATTTVAGTPNSFDLTGGVGKVWYIRSQGSNVQLTNIAFSAPKCAEPAFNSLANSDICSGDPYVALNGTATVADAGVPTYQWYREDNSAIDGETNATYTPSADGKYYVIAVNHLAGFSDNEKKSDLVTVTTYASAAITTAPTDVRQTVGEEATLSVVATGKAPLSYQWYTCDENGDNTVIITGAEEDSYSVTVTDGLDQYYKVVVSSGCGEASAIARIVEWVALPQLSVSATTTWDWVNAGENIKLTSGTTPAKNEECVMANVKVSGKMPRNDATFNSQALLFCGENVRAVDGGRAYASVAYIKFNTTVSGKVTVEFSTNTDDKVRCVKINGVASETSDKKTTVKTFSTVVPAGEVSLVGYEGETENQYIRISKIIFSTTDVDGADYTRDVTEGRYGTICLPKEGVMVGASIFELAYYSAGENKIFMDQVVSGEMVAGRPYVFLPYEGADKLGVYYTDDEAVAAGNYRGLYGYFDGTDNSMQLEPGDGHYILHNNLFREVTDSYVWIDQNRAYFKIGVEGGIPTNAVAPLPGRRRMAIGAAAPQAPTGLENGELINGENGVQKVLINGELFILRGEKMYDATGRLVK